MLSLNGFFVERTEWDSFLDVPPWDFLIESVLFNSLIRSSFFYYSAMILEIFLAASWISDFPFFVTNIFSPSFSGQYMLDHLNLFSRGNDKNGATNFIVTYESFHNFALWKELPVLENWLAVWCDEYSKPSILTSINKIIKASWRHGYP